MFPNGGYRTDWDLDRHGNVVANQVSAFDVTSLKSAGMVAVRLEAEPRAGEISRAAQATFTPQEALRLADGLRRAAENMIKTPEVQGVQTHVSVWA